MERLAIMGLGLGLTGALSGIVSGLAAPVLGMFGPFGKPVATLITALGVEAGAGMVGAREFARELGDGGQLLFIGQAAAAAGLPVGISSTFPALGSFGAKPAIAAPGAIGGGNTPSGTGAVPQLPAGGRYQPVPGYGSLSAQTGVGL